MPQPSALVVFTDQSDIAWLRCLQPGFRHCFVVVRDPNGEWIACDWVKGRFEFQAYGPCDPHMIEQRFLAHGHRVVAVERFAPRARAAGLPPQTCVEVVKQSLGLGGLRPITPYGLYVRLIREQGIAASGS